MRRVRPPVPKPRRSLLWRIFWLNTAVILLAVALLAATPVTVSVPVNLEEGIVLGSGLLAMLALDGLLMRRALGPLRRLRLLIRDVDPLRPGQRIDPGAHAIEVAEITEAFNDMLERLERGRRDSARRAQAAQEAERRRLSLELHDEVGQNLTALLLQLDVVAHYSAAEECAPLDAARETARECLEQIRTIAGRLRPEALDELGLRSALSHLCNRVASSTGLVVQRSLDRELPVLSPDVQLLVYRVAQESLTNVVRHAHASHAELTLQRHNGGVCLFVQDDGRAEAAVPEGSGIAGMRERALSVGARLDVSSPPRGGLRVRLDVPAEEVGR